MLLFQDTAHDTERVHLPLPLPQPNPLVAPTKHQHALISFNSMNPDMRDCLSYGWYVSEAYHNVVLSLNDSLNRLQLWMHEPHAPFEPAHTHDLFNS